LKTLWLHKGHPGSSARVAFAVCGLLKFAA
jgi:hypothetical protein